MLRVSYQHYREKFLQIGTTGECDCLNSISKQLAENCSQVADIAHTHGRMAAIKAAIKDMKHISPKQKHKRKQKHGAEVEWRKANPGKEPTEADITGQIYQTLYNWAMVDSKMGIGGPV